MPICSNCNKVGYVARTCFSNFPHQNFSRPNFRPHPQNSGRSGNDRWPLPQGQRSLEVVQSAPLASPSSSPRPTDISLSQETFCLHGSINSHPFPFLIDTGSSITAISHDTWLKISNPDIKLNTSVFLPIQSASGNFLCIYGSFDCPFEIDGSFYPFQTYIIHEHPCTRLATFDCSDDVLAVDPVPLFGTTDSSAPDTVVTDLPIDSVTLR